MKNRFARGAGFLVMLVAAACADGATDSAGTDATTANLLASVAAQSGDMSGAPTGSLRPGSPRVSAPQQQIDVASLGFDRGSSDAPVRVVEMSDYGCGYCRKFHMETWPTLQKDFVETGKVEWKFLPFINGMFENSPAALAAAECVLEQGDDLFAEMNHRIWEDQAEWKHADEPEPILAAWADQVGVDVERFGSCLSQGRREGRITAANGLSRQLGVRGTPTFFVVGYPPLQGALPLETFTQVLQSVYQEATTSSGG